MGGVPQEKGSEENTVEAKSSGMGSNMYCSSAFQIGGWIFPRVYSRNEDWSWGGRRKKMKGDERDERAGRKLQIIGEASCLSLLLASLLLICLFSVFSSRH